MRCFYPIKLLILFDFIVTSKPILDVGIAVKVCVKNLCQMPEVRLSSPAFPDAANSAYRPFSHGGYRPFLSWCAHRKYKHVRGNRFVSLKALRVNFPLPAKGHFSPFELRRHQTFADLLSNSAIFAAIVHRLYYGPLLF